MSLSFDPATLSPPRGHHLGGAFVEGAGAIEMRRPSDAVREEIFGPVLTLQTFATEEEEAMALADLRALRAMRWIEAGTVWVDRCGRSRGHILATGGYKSSGIGKDPGREACHADRRAKTVLIDI